MLTFNPNTRATTLQCLWHPYFKSLHKTEYEVVSEKTFDWSKDDFKPDETILKKLIYKEA